MILNFFNKGMRILIPSIIGAFLCSCDPSLDTLEFELPEANSKVDEVGPTAYFGYDVLEEGVWDVIAFSNGSKSASSYVWEFGDETGSVSYSSSDLNNFQPTFEYEDINDIKFFLGESKTFTVTLTVSDDNGLTDTYTEDIVILNTAALEPTIDDLYNSITATIGDFSSYQISKDAFASNTLDGDEATRWTASDSSTGDNMGDGEYVIYDLGSVQDVDLIRFTTDVKSDPYGFQISYSSTGTNDEDFTIILPISGSADEIEYSTPATNDFQEFEVDVNARYIKLHGFGRYNSLTGAQTSAWMNFTQMEFYIAKVL